MSLLQSANKQELNDIDIALCLACSSSLPPTRIKTKSKANLGAATADDIYITHCCGRPICPSCIAKNPRLARYNPCLHCLGGVGVVNSRSVTVSHNTKGSDPVSTNVDGAVRDEDVFVLGDEDEDEDEEVAKSSRLDGDTIPSTPPPAYQTQTTSALQPARDTHTANADLDVRPPELAHESETKSPDSSTSSHPPRYYINPNDTLLGIALKLKIDVSTYTIQISTCRSTASDLLDRFRDCQGHVLCRLNNLPLSTLRTTPHLLHTRTHLILPPTSSQSSNMKATTGEDTRDAEREAARARERAEKRMQTVTKEADWRIAKAYVALASLSSDHDETQTMKAKEGIQAVDEQSLPTKSVPREGVASGSLEAQAVNHYLDDEEWEQRERGAGRGVVIPKFPLSEGTRRLGQIEKRTRSWWSSWQSSWQR